MRRYVQAIDLERPDKTRCMRRPPATVSAELRAIPSTSLPGLDRQFLGSTNVFKKVSVPVPSSVDEVV